MREIKIGDKIEIKTAIDNDGDYDIEVHIIKGIEKNPNNLYVPYTIKTCCGNYIPTSFVDGRWENSIWLGSWKLLPIPPKQP